MSVPEGKRKESKVQYMDTVFSLNKELMKYLMMDFGIKENTCPNWTIEFYRNWMLKALQDLMHHLTIGNTIFPAPPNYEYWFSLRREHQKEAQAACYEMLQALKLCYDVLPINANKTTSRLELINKEITDIKNWIKTTNKQKSSLLKEEK